MLTPIGVTVADYWDAIKAGNRTHVRITFLESGIVLDDHDVYLSTGVNVTDMLNGDIDLVFGKTVCKQMTTAFINSTNLDGIDWESEFSLEFGVEIGSPAVTNWVTVGIFSGEKPNNITTANIIEFTAYDRMRKFDVIADEFIATLTYPLTVQDIYDEMCDFIGMSNDAGDELPNIMGRTFTSAPAEMEGYTLKDILAWIAQASGCYAKINASGNVQLIWFSDNTSYAVTGNEEFNVEAGDINPGMTWDEADLLDWDELDQYTWDDISGSCIPKVDELVIKQVSNDMDIYYPSQFEGQNVYQIVGNPFMGVSMQQDVDDYVVPIFDRLNSLPDYWNLNIDCIGNWLVEAGDIITVHVNEYVIPCPVFMKTMKWNGATNDSYETTGQNKRAIYANEADKQKILNSREIRLIVNGQYYEVQNGIVINENGVEITGDKHILMQADNDNRWEIDSSGLSLRNLNRPTYYAMQFGGQFDAQAVNTEAGVYAYNPNGDTTHGRIAFVALDMVNHYYNFIYMEYDYNTKFAILPSYNYAANIGKSGQAFGHIYAATVHALNALTGNSTTKELEIHPSDDDTRRVTISDNTSAGEFQITGRVSGNLYQIRLYGVVSSISSRNQKHSIKALEDAGTIIDKLKPVSFAYNNDPQNKKHLGLIYEDTVDVLPEICDETKQNNSPETVKSINYVELVPLLLKEIQDLRKRVAELEKEVRK